MRDKGHVHGHFVHNFELFGALRKLSLFVKNMLANASSKGKMPQGNFSVYATEWTFSVS